MKKILMVVVVLAIAAVVVITKQAKEINVLTAENARLSEVEQDVREWGILLHERLLEGNEVENIVPGSFSVCDHNKYICVHTDAQGNLWATGN